MAQQPAQSGPPATILVVDDSSIGRTKMRMAVRKLGHQVDVVEDGAKALVMLRSKKFDAVLLDILMPGLDGFDVLDALKADAELRDIPVIVVSALDEETDSVVKAIELGAEDFLPKDFDPVLLKARLGASLTKKRYRDQDREYMRRIAKLTEAAEVLETDSFQPEQLELDDLARGSDPLSRLAAVFSAMAAEIYERELRMKRAIQALQGSLLVVLTGVVWGMMPSLSRMASGWGSDPLGMAIWVNAFAGFLCLAIAAHRGWLPKLGRTELRFFLMWAVVAGILQRLTIFAVTEYIQASMLALIATLQSFLVFAFAAMMRLEKASPRRLLGLLAGLAGVGIVLVSRLEGAEASHAFWIFVALLLPALYGIEWVILARKPEDMDVFGSVAVMMLLSAALLAIYSGLTGQWNNIVPATGQLGGLFAIMGLSAAGSVVLALYLVASTGAVFASLSAYAMTVAGIVWGMLLLNETLTAKAWGGVALLMLGLYLVGPKPGDNKVQLSRLFGTKPDES